MTPLPRFASWDAFNGHLEEQCRNRQGNVLRGHRESIGERFVRDREALKRATAGTVRRVRQAGHAGHSLSLVRYRTNDYSVPVAYGHQEVWIRGYVHEVVIGAAPGSLPDTPVPTTGKIWSSIRSTTCLCWSTRSVPWIRPPNPCLSHPVSAVEPVEMWVSRQAYPSYPRAARPHKPRPASRRRGRNGAARRCRSRSIRQ